MASYLFLLHVAVLVYYFIFYLYLTFIFVPPRQMVGDNFVDSLILGPAQFVTVWNVILQIVYFSVALLYNVVGPKDSAPCRAPSIRRTRDYIFTSLVFPTSLFIGIISCIFLSIDSKLMFPKMIAENYKAWFYHVMHSNIVVFIFLEALLTFHQYPAAGVGLTSVTVLFLSHVGWMLVVYSYAGRWVYPVVEVLSSFWRIMFLLGCLALSYLCYFGGEFLNYKVWAGHKSQFGKKELKKATE